MGAAAEPPALARRTERPLGAQWRAEVARAQEAVLPRTGRVVVSCSAPFGVGGLGRHLKEIVDALERRGQTRLCICGSTDVSSSPSAHHELRVPGLRTALALPPVRFSPGLQTWASGVAFDAYAARRLPAADHLIAFNGQALAQFRVAREAHAKSVSLISANSHLRRVACQHARAYRQYPLERSWAKNLVRRNCAEYAHADRIYVASRYVWESFREEGFHEDVLSLFPLTPDPRYEPGSASQASGTFDILYIGSLTVTKGVPLLIDAFRRLPYSDMRLVLVGGWATRGMRLFIEKACASDRRINVCPGDPRLHLRTARLCIHPAYEDGFAYAPAEALACGVPVIVSENTGMKDLIDAGRNGLILPTGDLFALTEAADAAYRGDILAG